MSAIIVNSKDTDLGPLIEIRWPVAEHNSHAWWAADKVATEIRIRIPEAEVWFTGNFMGIRQPAGLDIVAIPGDTLIVIAGEVRRS